MWPLGVPGTARAGRHPPAGAAARYHDSMPRSALLLALLAPLLGAQSANPAPPTAPPPTPAARQQARQERAVGDFYRHRDDFPGALARYHAAQLLDPDYAATYFALGLTELKLNDPVHARQDLAQYLARLPRGPHAAAARKALARLPLIPPVPPSATPRPAGAAR